MVAGKAAELYDSRRKKRFRASQISSAIVVEAGGKLYQALQEGFLRFSLPQPQLLPDLVSLEELTCVEMRQAPLELLILFHRIPIRFSIEFRCDPGGEGRRDNSDDSSPGTNER